MSRKIVRARNIMRKSFEKDKDFEYGYISNMACLLHDRFAVSWKKANEMAKSLLDLIFAK